MSSKSRAKLNRDSLRTELKILRQNHFVPQYDTRFDPFGKQWDEANGVDVSVDHINVAELLASGAELVNGPAGTPPTDGQVCMTDFQEALALALRDDTLAVYRSFGKGCNQAGFKTR